MDKAEIIKVTDKIILKNKFFDSANFGASSFEFLKQNTIIKAAINKIIFNFN